MSQERPGQTPIAPAIAAAHDLLALPFTAVTVRDGHGVSQHLETFSSSVLFAYLHAAAIKRLEIVNLVQDGRVLTRGSLAALNCYLRSVKIGRLGLPWHRLTITRSKHDWRGFVAYLELEFE